MTERFLTGMLKGITPLFLLAVVRGIAVRDTGFQPGECEAGKLPVPRWNMAWRGDYRALAYAAAPILAGIWVHLYWSHEAGPRYFFPIVIMAAPLAGWGLLRSSAAVAHGVRRRHSSRTALLAGAAPLAAMLVVNLSVAWSGDVRARAASLDLGRWLGAEYGAATRLFGPDGITQVVNHYAQGTCDSFPETAAAAAVVRRMKRFQPDIVLLSTDRRGPPGDELWEGVAALGFEAVDRARLPGGCEKLQVLVRRRGGSGVTQGGLRSINLAESTATAHEARCPLPTALRGDKPRS